MLVALCATHWRFRADELEFPSRIDDQPLNSSQGQITIREVCDMFTFRLFRRAVVLLTCVFVLTYSFVSFADVASFATGGYARGLRSEELMKKMTDGTGMLTKDEWIAFHEKIFAMLDKKKTGVIDADEYISATGGEVVTFATGGYARGLRSKDMMDKI